MSEYMKLSDAYKKAGPNDKLARKNKPGMEIPAAINELVSLHDQVQDDWYIVKEKQNKEQKKPMSGYMTIQEAFECGDDDIPFIEGGFNNFRRQTKKEMSDTPTNPESRPSVSDILSDKWQVQKAEQKILTAEEWVKTAGKDIPDLTNIIQVQLLLTAYNAGDKNGQLKQWQNHEELRETVKIVIRGLCGKQEEKISRDEMHVILLSALISLKPLNQD
jgi:hypothetical protein